MIETILIDYLETELKVDVYVMMPEDLPTGNFIVLDRIGTSKENHVTAYDMAFMCYGDTALDAAVLNESVISAMDDIVQLGTVSGVRLVNSQMNTDIVRNRPRYQCTYTIVML